MKEEFHGENNTKFQVQYGWGTINASVWLPSLSELVGTTGIQDTTRGCYNSAMKGLNASTSNWADVKGGEQFTYFAQYNSSGGGEKIWAACAQEETWLRSPYRSYTEMSWSVMSQTAVNNKNNYATNSCAVHPAGMHWKRKTRVRIRNYKK